MSQEKSEKPTPRKRSEARKKGNLPRSPELGQWVVILVASYAMAPLVRHLVQQWQDLFSACFRAVAHPEPAVALSLLVVAMRQAFFTLVGIGGGVLLISATLSILQGGLVFATKAMKPDFKRLNPFQGLKNMFSKKKLWDTAKILGKAAAISLGAYYVIHQMLPMVGGLMPMQTTVSIGADHALKLLRIVGVLAFVLAAADYGVTRRRHEKGLMMTKQEVKDENKNAEGDPLIRSAIRSRQIQAARRRMYTAVPNADVLLVNPTHFAVALKYDPALGAPRVIAKGADFVAARIRELAADARVPTVHDVDLTRALFRSCDIGQEIPRELFAAVAAVLAFVITRRNRGHAGGEHETPRSTKEDLPDVPSYQERRRRRGPAEMLLAVQEHSDAASAGR
jgi:flagellar biosynthetic protein FlhB